MKYLLKFSATTTRSKEENDFRLTISRKRKLVLRDNFDIYSKKIHSRINCNFITEMYTIFGIKRKTFLRLFFSSFLKITMQKRERNPSLPYVTGSSCYQYFFFLSSL